MMEYPRLATTGPKPFTASPHALPSGSLGQIAPVFLLVGTASHMSRYTASTSSRPQKKWYVHLKLLLPGLPPRPMKYGCQGATVEMQGTPFASQTSATGFTVSGVDATSMRSMPSWRIKSLATSPHRFESDWLSLTET